MKTGFFLFLILLVATIAPVSVIAAPVKKGALELELIAEDTAIKPGGTISVGILLKHDPTWHTYWSHPGIVGMAPKLTWNLPAGVTAGEIHWPMPERTMMGPYKCYGYENDALLIIDLKADKHLKPGTTLPISVDVFWLICSKACIVNNAVVSLELPVATKSAKQQKNAPLFAATREAYPKPADGWTFRAEETKTGYTLEFKPPKNATFKERDIHFINQGTEVNSDMPQTLTKRQDGTRVLTLARFEELAGQPARFKGILLNSDGWNAGGTVKAVVVDTPLIRPAKKNVKRGKEESGAAQ